MTPNRPAKISIVGAGAVGACIAYACLIQGVAPRVAMYDLNAAKVAAETLDLNHGLQFVPAATLEGSADPAVTAGSDVVVITAGAKQKPGQSRLDLAAANTAILKSLLPQLLAQSPDAVILLVTNPVDVITYVAHKIAGLPASRILGSGTVLDSSRFRFLIAQRLSVAVQNVHAYIAGEHGDSAVPLWSSATCGNVPLHLWAVPGHGKLTVRDRTEIFVNVKQAAYQIIQGKGATSYAIGLATAQILAAIVNDESRILPVSSLMSGHEGLSDVCLSLPAIVDRTGVAAAVPVPMNDAERAGIAASAETIRSVIASVGF